MGMGFWEEEGREGERKPATESEGARACSSLGTRGEPVGLREQEDNGHCRTDSGLEEGLPSSEMRGCGGLLGGGSWYHGTRRWLSWKSAAIQV